MWTRSFAGLYPKKNFNRQNQFLTNSPIFYPWKFQAVRYVTECPLLHSMWFCHRALNNDSHKRKETNEKVTTMTSRETSNKWNWTRRSIVAVFTIASWVAYPKRCDLQVTEQLRSRISKVRVRNTYYSPSNLYNLAISERKAAAQDRWSQVKSIWIVPK